MTGVPLKVFIYFFNDFFCQIPRYSPATSAPCAKQIEKPLSVLPLLLGMNNGVKQFFVSPVKFRFT